MLSLGVKSTITQASDLLSDLEKKQIPFAASLAINRILQLGKDQLRSTMLREFDRPTPYTLKSLFTKVSTKTNLEGWVGHKDRSSGLPASVYLQPEIEGGGRSLKSTEKFLGHYVMPSNAVTLDQYGNIPGGLMRAIRQSVQSGGKLANGKQYIVIDAGNPRGLKPGVYQRVAPKVSIRGKAGARTASQTDGRLVPILFFSRAPHYRVRYDLEGTIARLMDSEFDKQFEAALDYALSTAKR